MKGEQKWVTNRGREGERERYRGDVEREGGRERERDGVRKRGREIEK